MVSLAPCRECGGKGKLKWGPHNCNYKKNPPKKGHKESTFALVQCLSCGFKTKTYKPTNGESVSVLKEKAIFAWNYPNEAE